MDPRVLERYLKQGLSLEQIGTRVDRHPSTVGYWLRKHGLVANGRERHSPRGGLERAQLEPLAEQGLTLREIASALDRSITTVRYWLKRFGIDLDSGYRVRQRRLLEAERTGVRERTMTCPHHGEVTFALDVRGTWRCLACRNAWVSKRRRRVKEILVSEAGGACAICGYNRYAGALQFHHVDPRTKVFAIGHQGFTRSLERSREEAKKCALLCANCHAEVEAGLVELQSAA